MVTMTIKNKIKEYVKLLYTCPNYYSILNHLKEILHYQKIRRPWVVDRLEEFGIEKKIVVLKNRRQVREFLKLCE